MPADSLTIEEFTLLRALYSAQNGNDPAQLARETGLNPPLVGNTLAQLQNRELIAPEGAITELGIEALEPYKVTNAIILAAGLSSRFAPISYERPKGTLRVRGEVLIERQIRQLREVGIEDITVVVGYKKEHYFDLSEKFGVDIVVNEEYASRNNNGSMWRVREKLANTYICSSDNYFVENPFESHVYQAYYSAVYAAGSTEEWCLELDRADKIVGCSIGGRDAWTMLGHVYFDRAFSQEFSQILEEVYEQPATRAKLWESIFLDHLGRLNMHARKYPEGFIFEFDSLDELQDFDPEFIENVDSHILTNISEALQCAKADIQDFRPIKTGLTNLSCIFRVADKHYIYRHPGAGTQKIVDRHAEHVASIAAKELGLDSTFITGNPEDGWKISHYVPHVRSLDLTDKDELATAMALIRRLHESNIVFAREFDYVQTGLEYDALLREHGQILPSSYEALKSRIIELKALVDAEGFPQVPSHNDFHGPNLLVHEDGQMDLIDWEYAGMSDIASDFGTLIVCSPTLDREAFDAALVAYLGHEPSPQESRHFRAYVAFAGWCWYVWALLKQAEGDSLDQWSLTYYRHATHELDSLLHEYSQMPGNNCR